MQTEAIAITMNVVARFTRLVYIKRSNPKGEPNVLLSRHDNSDWALRDSNEFTIFAILRTVACYYRREIGWVCDWHGDGLNLLSERSHVLR